MDKLQNELIEHSKYIKGYEHNRLTTKAKSEYVIRCRHAKKQLNALHRIMKIKNKNPLICMNIANKHLINVFCYDVTAVIFTYLPPLIHYIDFFECLHVITYSKIIGFEYQYKIDNIYNKQFFEDMRNSNSDKRLRCFACQLNTNFK